MAVIDNNNILTPPFVPHNLTQSTFSKMALLNRAGGKLVVPLTMGLDLAKHQELKKYAKLTLLVREFEIGFVKNFVFTRRYNFIPTILYPIYLGKG